MKISRILLLMFLFLVSSLYSQEIVKILTYNVLNYPNTSFSRNPKFELILDEIKPDIVVVEEISGQSGVNEFVSQVLGSKFSAGTYVESPDDERAIFYRDSLFQFISNYPISTSLRDINEFTVVHKLTLDTLRLYAVHLKASQGSDNEQRRLEEVTAMRNVTDNLSEDAYYMVLGDFNIYSSSEPAYQKLLDQSTSGYFLDPINMSGNWHNNEGYASIHTQSTRTDNLGDGATGGLDDRFDQILISEAINQPGGIDYVDGSYTAFGNDGNHFNLSINDGTNTAVSSAVADALHKASDHLPVYASFDFGLPSDVNEDENLPTEFSLSQNYPNPFNPSTTIVYNLPYRSSVTINVYDVLGRKVSELLNEDKSAGTYKITWNAEEFSSGIYFYSMEAVSKVNNSFYSTAKKMILVK